MFKTTLANIYVISFDVFANLFSHVIYVLCLEFVGLLHDRTLIGSGVGWPLSPRIMHEHPRQQCQPSAGIENIDEHLEHRTEHFFSVSRKSVS